MSLTLHTETYRVTARINFKMSRHPFKSNYGLLKKKEVTNQLQTHTQKKQKITEHVCICTGKREGKQKHCTSTLVFLTLRPG